MGSELESWDGESGDTLRERERLLAFRYGLGEGRRRRFDGEDLACNDLAEVERWVEVYTELVEFTHSALEAALPEASSVAADPEPDDPPTEWRPLMLQARAQELHLSYWASRLDRLRTKSGLGRNPATGP